MAETPVLNQRNMVGLLEGLGYSVTLADDIEQLTNQLSTQAFQIIFWELAKENPWSTFNITAYPFSQDDRPVIIAMVPFDCFQDYEAYCELGFDDYLNLPVSEKQLRAHMRHWHYRLRHAKKLLPLHRLHTSRLLARVGHDLDTLRELCGLFEEDAWRLLAKIRQAWEEKENLCLKRAMHELKGICYTLNAKQLGCLIGEMEQAVRQEEMDLVSTCLQKLEVEAAAIQEGLRHLVAEY